MSALQDRWIQVKAGLGQVVLLRGEAGIGKSRLIEELKDRLADEPHRRLECYSSPYYQNTAWHPITDLLHRILGWHPDETPEAKLDKLEQMLRPYRLPLDESVLLLASLLSLGVAEERYVPLDLNPQRQRQKTLEALVAIIMEWSQHQPVLLILEDLHWTDPTTLELLELLIAQAPIASLYILAACRPEFQPPWNYRSYVTEITVNRLSQRQIETMAEQVVGGKHLPEDVSQHIVDKTDGVPLFVEELTKAVLESGHLQEHNGHYEIIDPLALWSIPATLQDSLMARLDRFVTAKAVAQYAAVIGRQFSYDLLHAVSQVDESTLQRELRRLVEAELLYQSGFPPHATYLFKHALLQDVAYQSVLKRTRTQYHQRIAEVLAEQFPQTVETQPELLAHHYTEAGLHEQAIGYWQRAGEQAIQRSAHLEAIKHLTQGLELLKELPLTLEERTQQELMMYIALGTSLAATKGAAAPEAGQAYNRARELCRQTEHHSQNFPVLFGLWRFYLISAQLLTAKELASQLLCHAQRMQDPDVLVEMHLALGSSLFFLGDLTASQEQLEQGMSYYDSRLHRSHTFFYGHDPGVVQLSHLSLVLWLLGFPNRAQQNSDDTLMLAREVSHPYSLVLALSYTSLLHQFRREMQDVQGRTEEVISLATEQGFTQWVVHHMMLQDYCMAESSERENAIDQFCRSLSNWQATGASLALPYYLALLAEVYETANRADEGLATVHEAINIVDKTGERWFEAELYRLTGELLLKQSIPDVTQAEAAFQQALDIARSQQAKSWELRAAMSLSRLWQQQGKRSEAHDLLAPVYNWFTEGFDTADLIEAKTLLEALKA
jgi:predicted ATPase